MSREVHLTIKLKTAIYIGLPVLYIHPLNHLHKEIKIMPKFVLIGLACVGKSTTLKKCKLRLSKLGLNCEIQSTDDIIRKRFVADDTVILQFEARIGKKIPAKIFLAENPISAFMKEFGEEPLFRDLEEMFVQDIIASSNESDWFDLGGKAPLREGPISALRNKNVIPIFLYAEHETMLARLESNENWKKRSNYFNEGIDGWKKLAAIHHEERLLKYIKAATIIISIDSLDQLSSDKQKIKHEYKLKSTDELVSEIFNRINELKLAIKERNNFFINSLFKPISDKEKLHPTGYSLNLKHI